MPAGGSRPPHQNPTYKGVSRLTIAKPNLDQGLDAPTDGRESNLEVSGQGLLAEMPGRDVHHSNVTKEWLDWRELIPKMYHEGVVTL